MTEPPADRYDACVLGAGPAGALTASLLARRGRSVLLVDKAEFPRAKVCGGCLGGVGAAALDAAGLSLDSLGVPSALLTRVRVMSGGVSAELTIGDRRAIDRAPLDAALVDHARDCGVTVETGVRAAIGAPETGRRSIRLQSVGQPPRRVSASLVVLAAGLGGPTLPEESARSRVVRAASRLGAGVVLPADAAPDLGRGEIVMACGARGRGYVGLTRLADGRIDAAAALDPAAVSRAGLAGAAAAVLRDAGFPVPTRVGAVDWKATPRLTQRPRRLGGPRVLRVGDAAGYVEPFTGEGIGWALRGAIDLAPIADAAIDAWDDGVIDAWQRVFSRRIGRWQTRCRAVCGLIGGRAATPALVRLLRAAPWLAAPIARGIERPTLRWC
ncbi:MAG: FAD-dependent monooxygenase [Planctomycetota bacterium]